MDKTFDSSIYNRLLAFAKLSSWDKMQDYLKTLSNSRFRTASYVLADKLLPALDEKTYWECFGYMVPKEPKVYLVTFLKAALLLYKEEKLSFQSETFVNFGKSVYNDNRLVDRRKTLTLLLSELRTSEEVGQLLSMFCLDCNDLKIQYLVMSQESKPCYHVLFSLLRHTDLSNDSISVILSKILCRKTSMAYNFVCIAKCYFGIEKTMGNFSLTMQPYELSRLEFDYLKFVQLLTKM